jgi:hypothetical protein
MLFVRAIAYGAVFACATLPPQPAFAAEPSEDFYLTECLGSGADVDICYCMAEVYAPIKTVKADLVSAIMRNFLVRGALAPRPAEVKTEIAREKLQATDAEIQRAIAVAKTGLRCLQ